jgi:hypothetical protein
METTTDLPEATAAPRHALGAFTLLIKDHWRRARPTMYARLEQTGSLDDRVRAADRLTAATLSQLVQHGFSWERAWDLARAEWMIFPAEELAS